MGFIKRNNYDIFGALLGIILGIIEDGLQSNQLSLL
jgi:uncharacterized membrane protein